MKLHIGDSGTGKSLSPECAIYCNMGLYRTRTEGRMKVFAFISMGLQYNGKRPSGMALASGSSEHSFM
jgi:hypothetical protein